MFNNDFHQQLPIKLEKLLLAEKLHLTNKEALRCFLLVMLVNIFRSTDNRHLETAYITSSRDMIFLFVVNKQNDVPSGHRKKYRRMEMFVFDLRDNNNDVKHRKPPMAPRTRENLIAMLIADNFGRLLSERKFSKAKILHIMQMEDYYSVMLDCF